MIYRLDKEKDRIVACEETDFKSNNILERQHLEKWIENYPDILGEELLVITTEYSKFDKTSERLDILALDKDGELVVIELKRDESGKNVDLQAIKYAAYCSNMTLDQVSRLFKARMEKASKALTEEQAKQEILKFIDNEDFEELSDRPRIILVARQFRPEVTSSALWLRKFGLDVSCVRLAPHVMGDGSIAFESNVLIPLPEASDFIVESERKDNQSLTVTQEEYVEFYRELIKRLKFEVPREYASPQPTAYYKISTGVASVHYEWAFHGRPRDKFGVEVHFERGDRDSNWELLSRVEKMVPQLEKASGEPVVIQKEWGDRWSRLYVQKDEGHASESLKIWAVEKMVTFISMLQPVFDEME